MSLLKFPGTKEQISLQIVHIIIAESLLADEGSKGASIICFSEVI